MRKVGKNYLGLVSPFSTEAPGLCCPRPQAPGSPGAGWQAAALDGKELVKVLTVRLPQGWVHQPVTTGLGPRLISLQPVQAAALPRCPDAEPCTRSWQSVAGGHQTRASKQPSWTAGPRRATGGL